MNGEAVLGPIPNEWRFILTRDRGYPEKSYAFTNDKTGKQTKEDPRLPPLPKPWMETGDGFLNEETNELLRRDPRLTPEALRMKCPSLTTLRLV